MSQWRRWAFFAATALFYVQMPVSPASATHTIITVHLANVSGQTIAFRPEDQAFSSSWPGYNMWGPLTGGGERNQDVAIGQFFQWGLYRQGSATPTGRVRQFRVPPSRFRHVCWTIVEDLRVVNDPERCRRIFPDPRSRLAPGH
jgi:hypothetical protein